MSDSTPESSDDVEVEPVQFNPADLVDMEAEEAVHTLIRQAVDLSASDLFLLTDQRSVCLSVRRLGIVERIAVVPLIQGRHMISFIKANAGMDISEHRRPMDGRWLLELDDQRFDIRVNMIASLFGEDISLRIWDRKAGLMPLEEVGLTNREMSMLKSMLTRPSGLILVTGPTGTGKTTTLYACLQHLQNGDRKINTLEDPVEFSLDGVRQSQVMSKIGLGFSELLRNVLRQAPDIIMVGEIRDEDTADTAIRAANSGHLVLATLHAPYAVGAVQSMLALGSQPHFLSSCLLGIIAQRLVRTLCDKCCVSYDISGSPETFADIEDLLEKDEGKAIYGPTGCDACFQAGYSARTGLFELMTLNGEIRRLIATGGSAHELEEAAEQNGMVTFRRGALLKVAQGITSTEEILRDVPAEYLGLED